MKDDADVIFTVLVMATAVIALLCFLWFVVVPGGGK